MGRNWRKEILCRTYHWHQESGRSWSKRQRVVAWFAARIAPSRFYGILVHPRNPRYLTGNTCLAIRTRIINHLSLEVERRNARSLVEQMYVCRRKIALLAHLLLYHRREERGPNNFSTNRRVFWYLVLIEYPSEVDPQRIRHLFWAHRPVVWILLWIIPETRTRFEL